MSQIARRVIVSGRVTGVGFRYATSCEAGRYPGLAGYVRNLDHDTVECLVQGEASDVAAMVAWLRHGPPGAHVLEQVVSPVPPQDLGGHFGIVR